MSSLFHIFKSPIAHMKINGFFLLPLVYSIVYSLIGVYMKKFPVPDINHIMGYKTKRSMKSQKHWDFAQRYAPNEIIIASTVLFLISIPGLFIPTNDTVGMILMMTSVLATLFIPMWRTERALKRKFPTDDWLDWQ